jgi:hypothetical protein
VPTKSSHHRAAFQNAAVRLAIDRDLSTTRRLGNALLFRAEDQDGTAVTVAIDLSAWRSLESDHPHDAVDQLEQLALTGGWEPFGSGRVWRVILI